MMHAWVDSWANAIFIASWQGAIFISIVWLICRIPKIISPRVQCWLWRLVVAKLLLSLLWLAPVRLPVLPADKLPVPATAIHANQEPPTAQIPIALTPPLLDTNAPKLIAPTAPAMPFPWLSLLAATWIAGVFFGMTRLVLGWRRSRDLCRRAIVLSEPALLDVCDCLCRRMSITKAPLIAINDEITSPMLVGIVHPRILLPTKLPSDGIDMILAHELAHLRRRDLWWGWPAALVGVLYFFHPLVYVLRRQLRRAEEAACDSQAICVSGKEPHVYGRMLMSLLASQSHRFQHQTFAAGIVESTTGLGARLRLLADAREMSRRAVMMSALCIALIALAGLIPWRLVPKSFAAAATQPAATTQPAAITGRVLDADGKPAVGATVWLALRERYAQTSLISSVPADPDGIFSIIPAVDVPISKTPPDAQTVPVPNGLLFAVVPDVGVSQVMELAFRNSAPLQLLPASSLHLTVLNPDGTPDAGVSVRPLSLAGQVPASVDNRTIYFPPALSNQLEVKTDANGTCVIAGLPRTDRLLLDVADDRYASLETLDQIIHLSDAPLTTASITLTPAGSISGNVVYADGKPAGKTELILIQRSLKLVVTDDKGHFEIKHLQPGKYTISLNTTVRSRILMTDPPSIAPLDWVAQPLEITLAPGQSKTADMTLIRGAILTGKITDKATGKGIPGVNIRCDPDANQAIADVDGVYSMRLVPGTKSIMFGGALDGYLPRGQSKSITVTNGQTATLDCQFTPDPTPLVTGKVVDASGNPIAGARIFSTLPTSTNTPTRRAVTDVHGAFQIRVPAGTTLRARYQDLTTPKPVVVDNSGNPVILQISAGNAYDVIVTITDDQGAAIPNAIVRLTDGYGTGISPTPSQHSAFDGTVRFDNVATDLNGRLWVSADGFANEDYVAVPTSTPHQQQSFTVVLKRATNAISGIVVDETNAPAADAPVVFTQTGKQAVTTRTDAQGHFRFAVVDNAAGTLTVNRVVVTINGGTGYYRQSPVNAHAGQTDIKLVLPSAKP
jgi:beta-lactamase regulating signal transducer with metallopeptidase domain